jgi:multidrug efflux system membrane fusion protein
LILAAGGEFADNGKLGERWFRQRFRSGLMLAKRNAGLLRRSLDGDGGGNGWRRVLIAGGLGMFLAVWTVLGLSHPWAQPASRPPGNAVPVSVVNADRQDVPIWLSGLGTVQALNTVTVRARVDGTLMQVPVTEGQLVKQGTLLAVIDPRPYQAVLDQATAKKAQDEAQLANARLDLQRYASLMRQDFASHQQVDTQKMQVDQFTAALKGDEATIEAAQLNLSYCYIMAPFDGRLGLRQVDPGNLVHATDGNGIMTITQVHPIGIVFTLPQRDLPDILEQMSKGPVAVVAWSGAPGQELARGTLLTPDNAIDTTTGTIRLKATFPNDENRLWPGQFVEARLLLRTEPQVIAVPARAVQHGQDNLYVYVVKPDSTVHRQIVTAEDRGPVMVITQGLEAGQRIVLDGQSRLQEGTQVVATAPAPVAPGQTGG